MKKSKKPASRKAAKAGRKPIMRHSREGARPARPRPRSRRAAAKGALRGSQPSVKQQYLDVFQKEFPITLKVMRAYPSGKETLKPHERSQSAVVLAHAFTLETGVSIAAIRGELTMPPKGMPPPPATFAEALAAYERGAAALVKAVEEMPESRLFEKVTFFTGPRQIGEVPLLDILWLMLMDSIHHRGQLSVYVRLAGGKVPSIYGPSADEPWM